MSEIHHLLLAIEQGDPHAAARLLPVVYDELRRLAAKQLAQEKPGQTLDATGLVHEVYLRLAGPADGRRFADKNHFFATAAEAMRRLLVDNARRKRRVKHGGGRRRVELSETLAALPGEAEDLLALDEALTRLGVQDAEGAALVQLRYFAGLSIEEAADHLKISRATAYRHWAFARAWLLNELAGDPSQ